MHAYVINLENRADRWKSVLSQFSGLKVPIIRIDAVKMDSLRVSELYVAPGVAATWKSHQRAMLEFLKSNEDYGLVLEDDFLLTKEWDINVLYEAVALNPDFFQIGFLITGPIDRIDLLIRNHFDFVLKVLYKLSKVSIRINRYFGGRLLVKEQSGVGWKVVKNNIRAGGHAYLVSRKFAQAAQEMNSPAFTSADGMYISLGDVRSFRMFRFRKSIINQTNSATSVNQRYL